ncbi:MAG: threonine dehydratase [Ilumatobacter sp.]|jgi:threonine dehydratase
MAEASALPAPMTLTLTELDWARDVVARYMPPTPQFEWAMLTEHAGSQVTVKHENHTPVGAFKVRGGLVYFERLVAERPEVAGVVSATRGNHGQSLAYAGRAHGRSVTIFVPSGNSVEKNASMRALGATVFEVGEDFEAARAASVAYADEHGTEPVPPFHRDLVLGVATYARELFDAAGPLDTVYVPIGMGSGINAMIAVRDLLGLSTRIVGVVSENASASKLTFEAGHIVQTATAATFVDGVATRSPDPQSMAGVIAGAARVIAVSDDAVAEAMRVIYRTTHNVAESAGAISLAGLLAETPAERGSHSAFVLCGGNVDTDQLHMVLGGRTPTV